jgi:hypothetical protein
VFHDVSVLVGLVLAFFLVNAHDELIVDDLLQILVRSNAGVNKLHYFSDIFLFQDVGYQVRHHLPDPHEVFRLVLDDCPL